MDLSVLSCYRTKHTINTLLGSLSLIFQNFRIYFILYIVSTSGSLINYVLEDCGVKAKKPKLPPAPLPSTFTVWYPQHLLDWFLLPEAVCTDNGKVLQCTETQSHCTSCNHSKTGSQRISSLTHTWHLWEEVKTGRNYHETQMIRLS